MLRLGWTADCRAGRSRLLVPESHLQQPDASIVGGTALGASFGVDEGRIERTSYFGALPF